MGASTVLRKLCVCGLIFAAGCSTDATDFVVSADPHQLIKSLTLGEHVYNLATQSPYDRAQLNAVALMQDGTPVPGTIKYVSSDTFKVRVDSVGVLTGLDSNWTKGDGSLQPVIVTASVTQGGITRRDSAQVFVVVGPPPVTVDHIVVQPLPGDSAVQPLVYGQILNLLGEGVAYAAVARKQMMAGAYDASGTRLNALAVNIQAADTAVAIVAPSIYDPNSAYVYARRTGETWLYATTFAYGREYRDSILYRIGALKYYAIGVGNTVVSVNGTLQTVLGFAPDSIVVPAGSDVTWFAPQDAGGTASGSTVDVIFDDPSAAEFSPRTYNDFVGQILVNNSGGSGNIAPFQFKPALPPDYTFALGRETRLFNKVGTFRYHNSHGGSGVIVVLPEADFLSRTYQ
jgi:hypothetical protein